MRPRDRDKAAPAAGHQVGTFVANLLLCDVLASMSQRAAPLDIPVVEVFGNRYGLSGNLESGWLYKLPQDRMDGPVLKITEGRLKHTTGKDFGPAIESVHYVLAQPPAAARKRRRRVVEEVQERAAS